MILEASRKGGDISKFWTAYGYRLRPWEKDAHIVLE